MEIVKDLNLNRNPQSVRNGSLINCWNVKLSEDGTYITADDSIHDIISNNIVGNIIGIIPCNKEFVVLTDQDKIYRFKENDNGDIVSIVTCNTAWKHNNQERITGTYSYNIKNELIIAIAANDGTKIPLKLINLDKATASDNEDQYTPSPNIPIVNMTLVDRVSGTPIPQGLYYFFVRFKCQDETYTNWFPVGVPQYAIAKRPINIALGTNPTEYRGGDVSTTLLNNIKFDCPYGFKFNIKIRNNNNEYNKIQIGYILQHDNGSFGRKWREIDLTSTIDSITHEENFDILFDALDFQEEDIISLLESPVGLFDVNNITSYENRLYVANYKESDYDVEESQLRTIANDIDVKQYISSAEKFLLAGVNSNSDESENEEEENEDPVPTQQIRSYDYKIKITTSDGNEHFTTITVPKNLTSIALWNYAEDDAAAQIRNLIRNAVLGQNYTGRFNITYLTGNTIPVPGGGASYHETEHVYLEEDPTSPNDDLLYISIPNSANLNEEQRLAFCKRNGTEIYSYEFFGFDGRIIQDFDNYQTGFLAGNMSSNSSSNPQDPRYGYWVNGAIEDEVQNTGYFDTIYGYFLRCLDMTITKVAINTVDGGSVTIPGTDDTSGDEDSEYRKYNLRIPNAIRSLMPNEVYAFYVHYVRKDGSYTNGIQLFNKATDTLQLDKISGTLTSSGKEAGNALSQLGFNNLQGLKNCELYTYSIPENTISNFNVYKNINDKALFYTCNGFVQTTDSYKICKIVPIFTNVRIPTGYVGVFFSYAKVDPLNMYYAYTRSIPENPHLVEYKASEVETGVCSYVGSLYDDVTAVASGKLQKVITQSNIYISNNPGKEYDESNSYDPDLNNKSMISTFGMEGCIGLNVFDVNNSVSEKTLVGLPSGLSLANIRRHDNAVYSNKDALLISLGQILYGNNSDTYIYGEHVDSPLAWEEFNYPSFIGRDKIYLYKNRCFISDNGDYYTASYSGSLSGGTNNVGNLIDIISVQEVIKHSNFNLDALSVKKEPEIIVKGNQSGIMGTYYIVKPINMSDLLQYPADFLEKPYKTFVINDVKRANTSNRESVLRRSNVLADESIENTLRYFNSTDYKIFPKDKGKITNIIGLGYWFLVHTEHTLYSIDRNNLLKGATENVQVATPSTFDIEPKEMFTSSHGFGGMQTDSWTANHNGYFFYDKDSIELYNVDNGGLKAITSPIKRILMAFNADDAAFVTDFDNSRIIISFKKTINSEVKYFTISYNMLTKTFISLHSYKFDYGYNTKNRPYIRLIGSNKLGTTNTQTVKTYRIYGDWLDIANANNLIKVSANSYKPVANVFSPSIVEVIFNNNFEQVKTINFTNWIVKLIKSWYNNLESNMADEENYTEVQGGELDTLNRVDWYAGEILRVYTDLSDSLDLDIEITEKVNKFNNYKYPYFDRGAWNLNYFRNHLADPITNDEKAKSKGTGNTIPAAVRSDNRGLLYGRYIVLRFVFATKEKYNLPFKFNNINVG